MRKAIHPRDDIDRLYGQEKKAGLSSIEDSVDESI